MVIYSLIVVCHEFHFCTFSPQISVRIGVWGCSQVWQFGDARIAKVFVPQAPLPTCLQYSEKVGEIEAKNQEIPGKMENVQLQQYNKVELVQFA